MQTTKHRKFKFQSLTRFIIDLQTPAKSFALVILAGLAAGAVALAAIAGANENALLMGAALGAWLIVLPALAAAVLTSLLSEALGKHFPLRRSAYLSFFSVLIMAALFAVGGFLPNKLLGVFDLYLYSLVVVFAVRAFTLKVACSYSNAQALALALLHPVLCVVALSAFPAAFQMQAVLLKLGLASAITAAGVAFFAVLLNAPMRRNFGINAFDLANAFIMNWIDQDTAIERFFEKMGEKADTRASLIAFKNADGLKSVFVIPSLHAGPFGNVGGGCLVRIFEQKIGENNTAFVMHGTATHDLNPVSSSQLEKIADKLNAELRTMRFQNTASLPIRVKRGDAKVLAQKFGNTAFAVSTFAPQVTEDVDFSVGLALENTLSKHGANAVWVDAHNCYHAGEHTIYSGNPRIFSLLDAAEEAANKLNKARSFKLRQGVAVDKLEEFTPEQGVGETGLRVSVIEAGGVKTAYVLFDANNMNQGLREKIIAAVTKEGVDEVEVMTTDSHSVNNVRGVQNPLGWQVPEATLVKRAAATTRRAIANLEPAQVGAKKVKLTDVKVLGSQRTVELVSTVNSTIAVMKILTPAIFFFTILLGVISVLAINWA